MHGLTAEDLQIRDTARSFVESLMPYEVEAELAGGLLPKELTAEFAARAKERINATGYRRRVPDWHLVMARIAVLDGDTKTAGKHLAKTRTWIDQGWQCHRAEHAEVEDLLRAHGGGSSAGSIRQRLWRQLFG